MSKQVDSAGRRRLSAGEWLYQHHALDIGGRAIISAVGAGYRRESDHIGSRHRISAGERSYQHHALDIGGRAIISIKSV
ncbi:hypothetical protein ACFOGI_04240 [Virgibacillus xinjiangensis]|uniref:Transposase n=1 Tax=Virgibacillus xinjiangensis TaxID=393090 RepID=A0ABV7CT75_9BACI